MPIGAAAFATVLAACSSGGSPTTGTSPKASSPTVAATAPAQPPASATPSLSGVLTVSFGGLPASPSLSYGGAPLQFNVTVRNGTSSTYKNITVVVSMGHCSCINSPVPMAPPGTMQEEDTATGQWQSVTYDQEGGGTDYENVIQQPGFNLSSGASETFTFRIAFNPPSQQGYGAGQTTIDATVEALPGHTVIGKSPADSVPLKVTTS